MHVQELAEASKHRHLLARGEASQLGRGVLWSGAQRGSTGEERTANWEIRSFRESGGYESSTSVRQCDSIPITGTGFNLHARMERELG